MTDLTIRFPLRFDRNTVLRRFILLCAILISGGNLIIPRGPLLALMVLVGISAFGFVSSRIDKRNALIYGWISLVTLFGIVLSLNGDPGSIVVRLMNFLAGLSLVRIYLSTQHKNFLMDDLRAILFPTVYLGIATFFLALVVPSVFVTLESEAQRMQTFLGLFNYATPVIKGINSIRPIGIFWEPGVFSAYLNILFFVLMIQKARLFHVGLVLLAIVLTQSTTGIAVLGLQIAYFFVVKVVQRVARVRDIIFAVLVIATSPVLLNLAQNNISEKLTGGAVGSFTARSFDFETAAQVVRANPLVGIGFSASAYIPYSRANPLGAYILSEEDLDGRFNTNGVMIVLYSVGIPLGIIYLGAIFFQPFFPHRVLFGVILLGVLSSNPIAMTTFFVFLFFSGMVLRFRQQPSAASTRVRSHRSSDRVRPALPSQLEEQS